MGKRILVVVGASALIVLLSILPALLGAPPPGDAPALALPWQTPRVPTLFSPFRAAAPAPADKEAATTLKPSGVRFGAMNMDRHGALGSSYGVTGMPHIMAFIPGDEANP